MRSFDTPLRSACARACLAAALVCLAAGPADAGRRWTNEQKAPVGNGGPGDLAVAELEVFELAASGMSKKHLVRALVENRAEVDLASAWRLELALDAKDVVVAECVGESLPRERVGVCEAWLPGGALKEGDVLRARLDREFEPYDEWDGEPTNDERTVRVRTIPASGQVLRVATFDVQPRILHGLGDAQFRFTVEGGHLAWLLIEGEEPRLLAGHPADGIVSGSSTVRIRKSGPVTLVARNSLGAFVYVTIPVLNTFDRPATSWGTEPSPAGDTEPRPGQAAILPVGVYDVDENLAVLSNLSAHLASRDWASSLEELRRADERRREQPKPANALNPARRR